MSKFHTTWFSISSGTVLLLAVFTLAAPAVAQLQITEIMYDPLAANDNIYEWIEVRNLGASAVDLNGAFLDSLGDSDPPIGATANISSSFAANTIIPAGGVAIIYDAFLATGSPANYNDQIFRDSWGLAPTVPIIASDFWPGLNNSGTDSIGIWANRMAYDMDLIPDPNPPMADPNNKLVNSFANALVGISYGTANPWPSVDAGRSIQWSGNGDINDGANWIESESGVNGAVTNSAIAIQGTQLNNTNDVGNPGVLPGGTAAIGLHITEVMYNPRSTEPGWEWVEVHNNTGATINFATTPYVLDDVSGTALMAENITAGSIANGATAVLFDADSLDLTAANLQAAWGNFINFIPVNGFPALNNTVPGGDTFGLWSTLVAYQADVDLDGDRTFDDAEVSLDYDIRNDSNPNDWPAADGNASISLTDLSADPSVGASWFLSNLSDFISYSPDAVFGSLQVHPGGDVASPGSFVAVVPPGLPGDYNENGVVDAADYTEWRDNFGSATALPNDDTAGVAQDDFDRWKTNFGNSLPGAGSGLSASAVPEPASAMLLAAGVVGLWMGRRGRGR